MDAKQYLNQAYRLNDLIRSNEQEIADLNELKISLMGIDYSKDKVQVSPQNNAGYTKIVEKITDLERVIREDTERMLSLKLQIRTVINNVPDNEQRLVLKLRYLNFLQWEEVAEKINVSMRTAIRIHDEGIKKVIVPET